jgi:hypothetical protein
VCATALILPFSSFYPFLLPDDPRREILYY